jgi:uncharacterized protein
MNSIISQLARELNIKEWQVQNTVNLIDDGNTIPFIARYRKEVTGGLDDVLLRDLHDGLTYLRNLESRRQEVTRLIEEQGKLSAELLSKIQGAQTVTELEDLYRPFRPKRRTRATVAKEKGLEPLAATLWEQPLEGDVESWALPFLNPEKELNTIEEALQGAMDIIAGHISDNAEFRKIVREHTYQYGVLVSKGISQETTTVYETYYDYSEAIERVVPHRILAINRGEKEKHLSVKIEVDETKLLELLLEQVIHNHDSIAIPYIKTAVMDAYRRLIAPAIEREIRNQLTDMAEEQAIKVFGTNLRNLLLQPPIKGKVVMGIDPGYRTGNKIAVVDETGKVLDTHVVYITLPHHNIEEGKGLLKELIDRHGVDILAIGNGTASRETEIVVASLLKEIHGRVSYVIVNEAGASVYSASALGTEEFPQFDVALRSAVSIARRLQDPLAELVKIEPKAVGVGQYQHDVNQKRLEEALKWVVEDCVNTVGVDLNTASPSLLQYVAGINATVAKNIVIYREEVGKFRCRRELMKVPRLGAKAFEQCAGFLRILEGDNILDNTAVHPESYDAVHKLFEFLDLSLKDLAREGPKVLQRETKELNLDIMAQNIGVGVPTLKDILEELKKPGRDPRDELPQIVLRSDIINMEDLKPGMVLTGTVRNVVDFGAFVDIGVHQDGLVHISQLSNRYVKHPMDVVQVGDIVTVKVLDVDIMRKRISLTMK